MESDKNVDYLLNSAGAGDIENVRFYIESCSVDVNSTDDIGRTALHRAAYGGENSVIEYLLSKGANVNAKIECDNPKLSGATPLAWAVMSGHVDVAKTSRELRFGRIRKLFACRIKDKASCYSENSTKVKIKGLGINAARFYNR